VSPAIPVHTRVVLGYSTLASFSDGQSAVLKYDYKRLFANYRITPQNVFFQQRTRSLTIDTGTAHVSAAGDPKETIKAAFDMLRLMAVTRIRQVQPTAYFAVEVKGRDLSSFVDAHVDQLRKLGLTQFPEPQRAHAYHECQPHFGRPNLCRFPESQRTLVTRRKLSSKRINATELISQPSMTDGTRRHELNLRD
jgi:hypothetical protein